MVRAVLLGTGSPPPNPKRRGPATLLSLDDERFLVDAGSGVGVQLVQAGVRPYDYLARDIEVRRAHMRDREPPAVRVTEIEEGTVMEAGGVRVSAFLVEHDPVKPAYGFRFDGGGRSVVVSGDTRPCENLARWAHDVDCLIHECCEMSKTSWYPGCGWPTVEDKVQDLTSYHTQPDQIGSVAKASRAKGLVMTHLMPGSDPAELRAAARARYAGPVVVGEDLMEV